MAVIRSRGADRRSNYDKLAELILEIDALTVGQREQQVSVRCSKCDRVIALLSVYDTTDGIAMPSWENVGSMPQVDRDGLSRIHRPSMGRSYSDRATGGSDVIGRVRLDCHPKCGSSYTVSALRAVRIWLAAIEAGSYKIRLD